ncbi:hypothetical protein LY78DRAFT_679920 [Colletotrichum sublineola]|nr:hypothetical protein LY78DRAFT_679920 [Colletotrichum sublineola]
MRVSTLAVAVVSVVALLSSNKAVAAGDKAGKPGIYARSPQDSDVFVSYDYGYSYPAPPPPTTYAELSSSSTVTSLAYSSNASYTEVSSVATVTGTSGVSASVSFSSVVSASATITLSDSAVTSLPTSVTATRSASTGISESLNYTTSFEASTSTSSSDDESGTLASVTDTDIPYPRRRNHQMSYSRRFVNNSLLFTGIGLDQSSCNIDATSGNSMANMELNHAERAHSILPDNFCHASRHNRNTSDVEQFQRITKPINSNHHRLQYNFYCYWDGNCCSYQRNYHRTCVKYSSDQPLQPAPELHRNLNGNLEYIRRIIFHFDKCSSIFRNAFINGLNFTDDCAVPVAERNCHCYTWRDDICIDHIRNTAGHLIPDRNSELSMVNVKQNHQRHLERSFLNDIGNWVDFHHLSLHHRNRFNSCNHLVHIHYHSVQQFPDGFIPLDQCDIFPPINEYLDRFYHHRERRCNDYPVAIERYLDITGKHHCKVAIEHQRHGSADN